MTRAELEHIIRAAAGNVNARDIVVIGSQSILGSYPDAPSELLESMEADVFPLDVPARSVVIDGAIGELSLFHTTFGYYAHGVDETTAVLPDGWRERLVRLESPGTMGAVGWCLEPNDLAISKLAAGRAKDFAYVDAMIARGLASTQTLLERLDTTPAIRPEMKELARARLTHPD